MSSHRYCRRARDVLCRWLPPPPAPAACLDRPPPIKPTLAEPQACEPAERSLCSHLQAVSQLPNPMMRCRSLAEMPVRRVLISKIPGNHIFNGLRVFSSTAHRACGERRLMPAVRAFEFGAVTQRPQSVGAAACAVRHSTPACRDQVGAAVLFARASAHRTRSPSSETHATSCSASRSTWDHHP